MVLRAVPLLRDILVVDVLERDPTDQREEGFKLEMKENFPKIEVLETQFNENDANKAASLLQAVFARNSDLKGVFGANLFSAIGSANGVLTGMTGSSVVPGVMFLQAIGLPRDVLIQAMGMLFAASMLALAAALQQANFFTVEHGILSSAAVLPAIAGMIGGRWIRKRLTEQRFRTVFFIALLVLGAYIVANAIRMLR